MHQYANTCTSVLRKGTATSSFPCSGTNIRKVCLFTEASNVCMLTSNMGGAQIALPLEATWLILVRAVLGSTSVSHKGGRRG